MKKSTLIEKSDVMKCWSCDGEGSRVINESHPTVWEKCTVCDGTGQWVERHYIVIDNKNKIAFDTDTGG
jgi:DnaJ-class molecular chaperone